MFLKDSSVSFSQRKNYLLVGTADGVLTIYEDSVLKVIIKYEMSDPLFLCCIHGVHSLLFVTHPAGKWTAG